MDLIDNNADDATWASLMQPKKETARKAFERRLTAAYDHKATMEWLLRQEEVEKTPTSATKLEYEWTRVRGRKHYLAFKAFKEKYQAETIERNQRAAAIKRLPQFQNVQNTIPSKLFKHTALEKTIYGVVYAYYSITSLLLLVSLLTIDRVMSVFDRLGLTFEPAADIYDVQYAEWQQKNAALVSEGKALRMIDHEFYSNKDETTGCMFDTGNILDVAKSASKTQLDPTKNIKTELDKVIAQEAVVAKAKLQQVAKKVAAKE